jgi:hypothetical protein
MAFLNDIAKFNKKNLNPTETVERENVFIDGIVKFYST